MRLSPFLPRFVDFGVLAMMCYKVPKFRVNEGNISVFEREIKRAEIHSLSAIFFAKKMANEDASEDASLLFTLLCQQSSSLKTEGFLHIFTELQRRLTCEDVSFHYACEVVRFAHL